MRTQTPAFVDRTDAGHQLAAILSTFRGEHPLVLAIPRGGVPVGRVVADALGGELDVVLVRKIGAPFHPEYAIGAVDEGGMLHMTEGADYVRANAAYIEQERTRELELIRDRRRRYGRHRAPLDCTGRTVIVVDDGLATGSTMRAALACVRARKPKRLVAAVPVAAPGGLRAVRDLCDDIACVATPPDFQAVSQFYDRFPAVAESEVIALLEPDRATGSPPGAPAPPASVRIPSGRSVLEGELTIPASARGVVVFACAGGAEHAVRRSREVTRALNANGFATLRCELGEEEAPPAGTRLGLPLLARRIESLLDWAAGSNPTRDLPLGLMASGNAAAAALIAAMRLPGVVRALVSCGGLPDRAGSITLARLATPTLLVVGEHDSAAVESSRAALRRLPDDAALEVVAGATRTFDEAGAREQAMRVVVQWFGRHLDEPRRSARPMADQGSARTLH